VEGDDVNKGDLTVEILKDIRRELRQTHATLDETNARLDETNGKLDALGHRVVESEIRMATAITDLAHSVHDLTAYLRAQTDLRPRVERYEKDIAGLQTKLRSAY
jgi:hypothetical protein